MRRLPQPPRARDRGAHLALRLLVGVLVLVAIGSAVGWAFGYSLAKGFDIVNPAGLVKKGGG